ncbi:MAG: helix-turn-helix domain-containing protein [Chloroflexi bacterium]|nr:helix-turn-helix domain-containing protein [Chloroflexota bacterium]
MPSYLTTSDVATRLGVSLDTVRRWLRSGELKGTPFGRAGYRIEDADFQAFLDQRRRHPQESATSSSGQPSLSNAVLEEFMSAVGQELRTPLTTTRGALQQARRLLQRALESPLSDNAIDLLTKLQDLLTRAERQISAEMRLVGNLLDASRIEANKFELTLAWCNLAEIVRETVTSQQELSVHRLFEMELPVDDLVAVIADADRIRQVLTNYLTNALKFSPTDQPIKIYLEVTDVQARVSVQDRGPGIPDSEQTRIWERFQQSQRQSVESRGGLGLGLYITRAIIQQHHGYVGVESHVGEGSTFWFTLPLADETWP